MATKKKAKRGKKAKKGFLLKNKGGLFNKSSDETINPTKKFIKSIDDDNENIELTETGKTHFETLKKQKAIESMETPVLLEDMFQVNEPVILNSELFLELEETENLYDNIKYFLKSGDTFILFTENEIIFLDFALTEEERTEIPYPEMPKSKPSVKDEFIIFSSSKELILYNTVSKEWNKYSLSGEITSEIILKNDYIYLVTDYSKLISLNSNFKEEWSFLTEGYLLNTPIITDEYIYFTSSDGMLYKLDKEGDIVWSYNSKAPIELPPQKYNNEIIFINMSGKVFFINEENKDEIHILDLGFPLTKNFLIKENFLYIPSRRFLFKIDLSEHKIKEIVTFNNPIEKISSVNDFISVKTSDAKTLITDDNFTNLNYINFEIIQKTTLHGNFLVSLNSDNTFLKTNFQI